MKNGDLKIHPKIQEKVYLNWLENIQEWCLSRQLWWGHRIPVYLVTVPGVIDHPDKNNNAHWVIGRTEAEARLNAAKKFNVPAESITLE